MANRIDNIRAIHILLGCPIDTGRMTMPRLALQIRAFKKARPEKKKEKVAIGGRIMMKMMQHLSPRCHDQQTLRAVLAFAHGGMLRVSEYSYGSGTHNKPTWRNITSISQRHLTFAFRPSKTNQTKRREEVTMCCRCPSVCAIHELLHLVRMRGGTVRPNDFIFQLADGTLPTAVSINHTIKNLAEKCGIPGELVSSHCIRAGAITDALTAGVPDSAVQLMARHADARSMRPYNRPTPEALCSRMQQLYQEYDRKERKDALQHGVQRLGKMPSANQGPLYAWG